MRRLFPIAGIALLVAAVPALAADRSVNVNDDYFDPADAGVEVGDTVTWNWTGNEDHNVTATPGKKQIERFRSATVAGAGQSFAHSFQNEGRFTYLCTVHSLTMKGVVRVGTDDDVGPRIRKLRARVYGGDNVKVSFRLSERAVVTVKLTGEERKTVTRVRGDGRGSIKLRNLDDGDYRVTVRAKDGFGNRAKKKSKTFSVG